MKMIHIVDRPPLYTNCFVLIGNAGHAVAIDPAAKEEYFTKALEENNAQLTHILLTHGHFDHVGSVEALRKRYGAKLIMNAADAKQFGIQPDEVYTDFGTVHVDDIALKTVFTPGHSPGSTCIQCNDLLFTGDTLFAGDIGRTDLAGGNDAEMQKSLKKLCETFTKDFQVLPGHEEFSTLDEEKRKNPYLQF